MSGKEYSSEEHGLEVDETLQKVVDKAVRFENGDSFIMDKTGEHLLVCCDCGLTHKIQVEEVNNGLHARVITWRSEELTKAFRENPDHHFPLNPVVVDNREDEITKPALAEYIVLGSVLDFMTWCKQNNLGIHDKNIKHCRSIEVIKGLDLTDVIVVILPSANMKLVHEFKIEASKYGRKI
jgi:hypothetical protein